MNYSNIGLCVSGWSATSSALKGKISSLLQVIWVWSFRWCVCLCKRMRFSCCRPQSFISDLLCVYSRTHGCCSTEDIRSVCKESVVLATFKHLVGFFSLNCMHVQSLVVVDVPCPAWVRSQSDTALRQWSDLVVEEREGGSSQTRCWIC